MSQNGLFEPSIYKTNILPRQARDKHRESSQKKDPFFLSSGIHLVPVARKFAPDPKRGMAKAGMRKMPFGGNDLCMKMTKI